MNKKLKYLSAIPLYGTCILLIYLFVLSIKDKIAKKKFVKTFIICAIVSAICFYMISMIMYIFSMRIIDFNFEELGMLLTMIVAGYMMNAFTFTYVSKKWDYLFDYSEQEKKSFFEMSKKKILLIGCALAIIITIFAVVMILALGLV